MRDKFRQSMSWLHTWSGLILGWLLFAIFFTGTYSYFRTEITYWMTPELHGVNTNKSTAELAEVAVNYLEKTAPDSPSWSISFPTSRFDALSVSFRDAAAEAEYQKERRRLALQSQEAGGERQGRQAGAERGERSGRQQNVNGEERPAREHGAERGERSSRPDNGEVTTTLTYKDSNGEEQVIDQEGTQAPERMERQRSGANNRSSIFSTTQMPTRLPSIVHYLDPQTGEKIETRNTRGGTFLYRFHVELYGIDRVKGRMIIGIATMCMFIAIITGVIIHKRIFKDFFIFRRGKGTRSWMDAHIFTAVLALPFHIMITYSGLLLLMTILLPWNSDGIRRQFTLTPPSVEAKTERVTMVPIAPIIIDAEKRLNSKIERITVSSQGKNSMMLEVVPVGRKSITATGRGSGTSVNLVYKGSNGRFYGEASSVAANPVVATTNVFYSLHLARYADIFTRWIFFILGSLGTVMAGTGLVIWTSKKSKSSNKSFGRKLVEILNVGAIAGLTLSTGVHFWANRLIPSGVETRTDWEVRIFFISWLLSFIYPAIRGAKKAWFDEFALAAALFLLMPVLNAFTSKLNLFTAIAQGNALVAGFDLTVFGIGLACAYISWKIKALKGANNV